MELLVSTSSCAKVWCGVFFYWSMFFTDTYAFIWEWSRTKSHPCLQWWLSPQRHVSLSSHTSQRSGYETIERDAQVSGRLVIKGLPYRGSWYSRFSREFLGVPILTWHWARYIVYFHDTSYRDTLHLLTWCFEPASTCEPLLGNS